MTNAVVTPGCVLASHRAATKEDGTTCCVVTRSRPSFAKRVDVVGMGVGSENTSFPSLIMSSPMAPIPAVEVSKTHQPRSMYGTLLPSPLP